MKFPLILVSKTQIDWPKFLKASNAALGRSVTGTIDSKGVIPDSPYAFLLTMGDLKDFEINEFLNNPGGALKHLHFTFLTLIDNQLLIELVDESDLHLYNVQTFNGAYLSLLSGTLEEWRTTIINCCSDKVSYKLRQLMDECFLLFEKEKLSKVWSGYSKTQMKDNTFRLEGPK